MTTTTRIRPLLALPLALAVAAAGLIATPAVAAVSADAPVVVSEVYGGGGNNGAPFNRDFVELRNTSAGPVDLAGWSVQYASTSGSSWQTTPLGEVTLAAGEYLLVGQALGAGTTLPAFDADVEGTIAMSGSGGKVALVSTTAALSGATGISARPEVVDYVGWGSATDFAGTAPAPGTTNATSVSRTPGAPNATDNAVDFALGAPTPTGRTGDPDPEPEPEPEPEPDPEVLSIAAVQGAGDVSPYAGRTVTTTGVVTASYPTGGRAGFVVQTAGTGGAVDLSSPRASDAVAVYAPAGPAVAIGETIAVTGAVGEFYGLTQITVDAAGVRTLPAAAPVIPAAIGWPASDGLRESLESMLVQPTGPFTVTNTFTTNQYGEVGLAAGTEPLRQPTDVARPGSPEAAAVAADNAARTVTLDDGSSVDFLNRANSALTPPYVSLVEPVVVGAGVTFTAPVVVTWRNDAWKLDPIAPVTGDGSGADGVVFADPRQSAPSPVGGDVAVASFNVLNYFTTLGTDAATCTAFTDRFGDGLTVRGGCAQRGAWDGEDLDRQQDKIVAAIEGLDADVVGLIEIENSAALGEPVDEATASLVAALNAAAGAEKWAYVPSSADLPDHATRDVITNAIIYQPAAVTPVGPSLALGTLSEDDQAFGNAREPVGQVFRPAAGGERLLVVVNHFKSKGSAGPWPGDADTGDGQGSSNESRVRQATALRDWVASVQGDVDSVALVGDFNSYSLEDPLQVLYDAGYVNAERAFDVDTSSYSFGGLSGSLDHVLLSQAALDRATGADIWNINSGESVALEYSRYDVHGTTLYAPDAFRSSDHDPVIVGFAAGEDERVETRTRLVAVPPVQINRLVAARLLAVVTAPGGPAPDGTVEFSQGDTVVGTSTVSSGLARLTLPRVLPRGVQEYTATFVPADPEAACGSTSDPVRVRVLG